MTYCAMFPGQGSQKVGMGSRFYESVEGKKIFEKADDLLGFSLSKLCFEGPIEELTITSNSQPAILLVSYLAFQEYLNDGNPQPDYTAGHSLGEYTALVASGVLEFEDALLAVRNRGKYMLDSFPVGEGAMAAVLGADREALEECCEKVTADTGVVQPANYNCPGQIVISGQKGAVNKVLESFKGVLLQVSSPFHCKLMENAAAKMSDYLKNVNFQSTDIPVVSNIDNVCRTQAEDFPPSLVSQITEAVRWDSGIVSLIDKGVDQFIEFGEGKVLSGLMKRIDKKVKTENH